MLKGKSSGFMELLVAKRENEYNKNYWHMYLSCMLLLIHVPHNLDYNWGCQQAEEFVTRQWYTRNKFHSTDNINLEESVAMYKIQVYSLLSKGFFFYQKVKK